MRPFEPRCTEIFFDCTDSDPVLLNCDESFSCYRVYLGCPANFCPWRPSHSSSAVDSVVVITNDHCLEKVLSVDEDGELPS